MPGHATTKSDDERPEKRPELVELGDRLRALRDAAGKTQERVADDGGVHWTYVGQIERGERNPSYLNLRKLATGLGITVSELVDGL